MGRATANFCPPLPASSVLWRGQKVNIIKFRLHNQYMKHIKRDFHFVAWVKPLGYLGTFGTNKLFFSNMVMWHIKLKWMMSRTGIQVDFLPQGQTVVSGVGSIGQTSSNFFESVGIFAGAHRLCVLAYIYIYISITIAKVTRQFCDSITCDSKS